MALIFGELLMFWDSLSVPSTVQQEIVYVYCEDRTKHVIGLNVLFEKMQGSLPC